MSSAASITNVVKHLPLQVLDLTAFTVFALYRWQGSMGFNLADEGFLWYGAKRVLLGEVPIRDFMAYDPGRYYWSGAIMALLGNSGIMALRVAISIFQAIGLFVGLLLIARNLKKQSFFYVLLSAATLTFWMFPRYKLFDISISILSIWVLAFLVQSPTSRRYFFTGICVGLIATFGRNHGVYAVVGCVGLMLWLNIKRTEGPRLIRAFAVYVSGVIVGFSPILFMTLLVPGFASAFWDSICFQFEIKATNLPLPIPWPWLVNINSLPIGDAVRGVLVGLFFIATIVFGVLSIVWITWQKFHNRQVSSELVSTSFLGLPYAHYAFSRADVDHLALGIFPLLVGCLVLLATLPVKIRWPTALILCTASIWVSHIFHPGWQCYIDKRCVTVEISGSNLQVDPSTANDVALLRNLAGRYAANGESFISTPFWPGAYALLDRKSPMWEIYALFPRTNAFELAEIERLKSARPKFSVVLDLPLDGRNELRFSNTHPLIYQYIHNNFKLIPYSANPAYFIFMAEGGTP